MWKNLRVHVLVPAKNEAPRIARVVTGLPAWIDQITVVDDGSADGTSAVVNALRDPRVRILRHQRSRGVGAAIVRGYSDALHDANPACDVFVVMAGDGQMDPSDLPALLTPIADGQADYVKGNRFATAASLREMPLGRRIGGRAFSLATSWAIGQPIRDSQCGYTALRRTTCARLPLASMWPRFGYPNDLLSLLKLQNARICEVEVKALYRDEVSKLRLRNLPAIGALIVRARLRRARAAVAPKS